MALKTAIVQAACRATTGNQDFTDAVFSGETPVAAIVEICVATAEHTSTATERWCLGFTDGTTSVNIGCSADDGALGAANNVGRIHNDSIIRLMNNSSTGAAGVQGTATLITGGLRIAFSAVSGNGELIKVTLIGGSGVVAKVVSQLMDTTNAVTVNHSLGVAPKGVMAITTGSTVNSNQTAIRLAVGFAKISGGSPVARAGVGCSRADNNADERTAGISFNDCVIVKPNLNSTSAAWRGALSSVTTSQATFTPSASASTETVGFLFIGGDDVEVTVGQFTTPTSTGSVDSITGLPADAQLLLMGLANVEAANAGNAAGEGDSFGFGMACNNSGIAQCAQSISADDGATGTLPNKTQSSATQALRILLPTGAVDLEGAVTAMDREITVNYTAVGEDPFYIPYMVLTGPADEPGFSANPSVTSNSTDGYTVGFTPDANCTAYLFAYPVGASAPTSVANGISNALANVSKAVTGADSLTLTGLTRPLHDLYVILSNGGGESSPYLLDDEFKDPPAGYQYVVLADLTAPDVSLKDDMSPAAELGDVLIVETHAHAFDDSQDFDNVVDDDWSWLTLTGGYSGRVDFDFNRYRPQDDAYDGVTTVYDGNSPPAWGSIAPQVHTVDVDPGTFACAAHVTDAEGDTLTYALAPGSDPLATGRTLNGATGEITGTPTVVGESGAPVVRATDITGEYTDSPGLTYLVRALSLGGGASKALRMRAGRPRGMRTA